jgi:hypothetical protein
MNDRLKEDFVMVTAFEITNFQELIPPWCQRFIKVSSQEDILSLGKATIGRIVTFWRSVERAQVSQVKAVEKEIRLLSNIDTSDLEDLEKTVLERKQTTASWLRFLVSLEKKAEKKPLLCLLRPENWFQLGDRVVLTLSACCDVVISDKFVFGRVVKLTSFNPVVTILTDVVFTKNDYELKDNNGNSLDRGRGFYSLFWQPWFMLEWEFEYFKSHPEFFRFWMNHFWHDNLIISPSFAEDVVKGLTALTTDSPVA